MNLRGTLSRIKQELQYYRAVMADPRTPKISRWLLGAAFAYLLSPIDLIPDFVPIIGHLDDLIIVGGLVLLARLLIPNSVLMSYDKREVAKIATVSKDDRR